MRILAAMSGGVDSSVAAAILRKEGSGVVGATFKFWPPEECLKERARSCCSLRDIEDARSVCAKLGIAHYVIDCQEAFERDVIGYFCGEYANGRTPNPCILCNEKIKFGALIQQADALGCDYVATGHYARVEPAREGFVLKEALDKERDQSYVLFSLTKSKLSRTLFPLGALKKSDVRSIAKGLGLNVHDKPDSQDICFIDDGDTAAFLKKRLSALATPGDIVDTQGTVVGAHEGICFYTIGQRKGIGSHGTLKYVVKIDAKENRIVIGGREMLEGSSFYVDRLNWISRAQPSSPIDALVKIRYLHQKMPAKIYPQDDRAKVEFLTPQSSITPGQAAVFYDGDVVIGGGWIV